MRQMKVIEGRTPEEFAKNYNEFCSHHRIIISQELFSANLAYVFYEIEEHFYEEEKPKECKLYCADCVNYEWGKGCPFKADRVLPLDLACEFYNQEVPTNEEVQS